jgi:uncharacterized protein YndB with AHSA1/START domain
MGHDRIGSDSAAPTGADTVCRNQHHFSPAWKPVLVDATDHFGCTATISYDISGLGVALGPKHNGSAAMTLPKTLHATLVFERQIPAPVEKVFTAFADPVARTEWGAPSDAAVLIYDETDFREGGQDRFRCGSKANPNIHGTTRYLEIIANRRVVSSETIVTDGLRLCASLATLELTPDGEKTKLKSTIQLASFIGEDMVKGHERGNNVSLDNLVQYFLN